ncbi:MAG TPA: SMP-30/gluconolactonase/LRE family protein [Ramlibacter sp.]|nr:SMP-30/gluconolactonase/LRE family protein [Ramlibacter sp.]
MYAAPPLLNTEIFSTVPEHLRTPERHSDWVAHRGAGPLHSFLEGPSFDREGNFFCVDVAHSRIFKITPSGDWTVFAEYDGCPNGLKLHRDGRLFVTDRNLGILSFDPVTAKMTTVVDQANGQRFHGPNDLIFNADGDLFFTDPGETSMDKPHGAVYRLRKNGELDLLCGDLAGPNGLVLNKQETVLHVAVTHTNCVIRIPLRPHYGGIGRVGMFIRLSGSPAGPDGMAIDQNGNIVVVHAGFGTVWVFSPFGEPLWRINSCAGIRTTNVAFGGPEGRTLFITEAEQGVILKVDLPVPGETMYGLS